MIFVDYFAHLVHLFIFRELLEESGLTVNTLEKIGNLKFEMVDDKELLDVHVFRTDSYNGEPTESEGRMVWWWAEPFSDSLLNTGPQRTQTRPCKPVIYGFS